MDVVMTNDTVWSGVVYNMYACLHDINWRSGIGKATRKITMFGVLGLDTIVRRKWLGRKRKENCMMMVGLDASDGYLTQGIKGALPL